METPAALLRRLGLAQTGWTQMRLAEAVGVDPAVINRMLHGHHGITAKMAMRLSKALGTTPELWMQAQNMVDLEAAKTELEMGKA